jgi:hypothetical protein
VFHNLLKNALEKFGITLKINFNDYYLEIWNFLTTKTGIKFYNPTKITFVRYKFQVNSFYGKT